MGFLVRINTDLDVAPFRWVICPGSDDSIERPEYNHNVPGLIAFVP